MKHSGSVFKRCLAVSVGLMTAYSAAAGLPALPASAAKLLSAEFETTNDSFTGRGGASVQWTSDQAYQGNCSLFVSDRNEVWKGASRDASTLLTAGGTYSLSAAVYQASGEAVEMKFSMQYSDGTTTKYSQIALETVSNETWTVLSNTAFEVPADASDMVIYMETTESKTDFYLDSVTISGAPSVVKKGDANGDLNVDSSDIVSLVKYLACEDAEIETGADMDGNEIINAVDLSLLKNYILFPPAKPHTEIVGDWDNYQEKETGNDLKALQGSLLRLGNTARIREKIAKAQRGEKVTVGYIGGSITEGGSSSSPDKSYVNISGNYFKNTFGTGNNVSFVNAGLAGTSSVVGNMRVDGDIFSKGCEIIFIEFAVNDQGSERFQKSYEALVKKCLMQENEPAVVLITLCQKGYDTNEDWMAKVGENYDLPVISGRNALKSGSVNWDSQYGSGDNIHPGNGGHQMIADWIGYYYRQALRSENASDEYTIPSKEVYGAEYANNHLVDFSKLTNFNAGSWTRGNDGSYNYSKNGNTPMTFTVEGKGILLLFKSNSSGMGAVNVSANGKTNKVSSNLQWTWGGKDGDVGYYQNTSGTLDISISSADNGTFVLYGISVIE
ncbi:MAG: carbohydrate binding domain-containing protein [Oscillospiraceae bacterium]|nr:carbohydrate binding domain-containing protein [Oscillospiraceae bacterium]